MDGTISGGITGGLTGGVGYGLSTAAGFFNNPLVRETAESVAETAIGAMDTLAHGGTVTAKDLVQDFALNMVMDGGGASKADDLVDAATSKQARESFESFADLMSPEDAKWYNNFLKNGSDSGLTADELAGIRKVDDQLALNQVDYDEVLEVRKGNHSGVNNNGGGTSGGVDSGNTINRKADFYVTPSGDAIPSTGYRYTARNPELLQSAKNGTLPARNDGMYFSFDKMEDAVVAQGKLQIPYKPEYRIEFDTMDIIDDIHIPYGKWGTTDYLEPLTQDFKNFGPGKATQAITYSAINSISGVYKMR